MPSRVRNTVERDNLLILMRAARASWDDIAAALGVSRSWAIERGHRIGAKMQPKAAAESARKRTVKALPEGHDVTWSTLTAGGMLEGEPYPKPKLRARRGSRQSSPQPDQPPQSEPRQGGERTER
jgi:hypothetical protein